VSPTTTESTSVPSDDPAYGFDTGRAGGNAASTGASAVAPAMVTDLYELTMAAAYWRSGVEHEASFDLFVRSLPAKRRFLVAAGLDAALAGLEQFRYGEADLTYLDGLSLFPDGFLDVLAELRFTGDVWAVPEGELVFAGEPLLRVTGPILEAQLVETFLLNQMASNTMVASKAARVALACGERAFVDFSARRDHGTAAALTAARSSWIAGSAGTSLVAAGQRWGIPTSGTMAHSFVMSFDDERDAFRAYARAFRRNAIFLIDTYDTLEGARNAAQVAQELADEGIVIRGVRLDSGDLGELAIGVRRILDEAGFSSLSIFASGDLDEHRIAELVTEGAPIDAFGVGTQLGTSGDASSLGAVYKLVEDADGPRMKLAEGKVTWPGRKQVWRRADHDVVSLHDEEIPEARPLLVRAMGQGRRLAAGSEPLHLARERCREALAGLPGDLRRLEPVADDTVVWPVEISAGLRGLADAVRAGRSRVEAR
jgi:nicotinate phosphoribosyltransferase